MDKSELVIMALQQRIGELVSNYETQIALLRAELTKMAQDSQEKDQTIQDYSEKIDDKISIENIDQC
jgi:hypothetical protein